MRPRGSGEGWVTFAWVVAGLGIAGVLAVVPLIVYGLVAGDPYTRMFVEHRADGFYLGRRACDPAPIRTVSVSAYDRTGTTPNPPVWTATATDRGATTVRLFGANAVYETHPLGPDLVPRPYDVLVDPGTDEHGELVVDLTRIPVGRLDFGDGRTVTPEEYARMPDSDFGCV